jgi:excisionase family DNA binding protein
MTCNDQDNSAAATGERVLTSSEVADLFRVSIHAVRMWVKAGKLASVSPGAHHRFRESDVLALLNGQPS